jgi:hypothetical protein
LGFQEEGVVVLGDCDVVAVTVEDADNDVEDVDAAIIEGEDEDRDAEENPWETFAKRPTQKERKTRWSIRFAVDIVTTTIIIELENFY